jgi:hypothetical protein
MNQYQHTTDLAAQLNEIGIETTPAANDANTLVIKKQNPDNLTILVSSERKGCFAYAVFHCNTELLSDTMVIGKTNASIVKAAQNINAFLELQMEEFELAQIAVIALNKATSKLDLPASQSVNKNHSDYCVYSLKGIGKMTLAHGGNGNFRLDMAGIIPRDLGDASKLISHISASNVSPAISYDISGTANSTKLTLSARLTVESLTSTLRMLKRLNMLPTQER